MADVTIKGLAELQKFLDELPVKLERNIMRGALRAGAKVIRDAAKANIRSVSGRLAASLDHKGAISVRVVRGTVLCKIRAGHGFGVKGQPPGNLPIWVEYGTRPHTITAKNRKGLSIGGMIFQSVSHPGAKRKPFMRPALDTQAGAATVAVGEYIRNRLATKNGLDTSDIIIEEGE